MDGLLCYDYGSRIPSHVISKTCYVGYDMKSWKMIMWSRWDHLPLIFEEIDSKRCNEILSRGRNIRGGVPDDFLYVLVLTRVIG